MLTAAATFIALVVASLSAVPAEVPRIEQLLWLSGCWETSAPQRTVEEHWLPPRGGTMIGVGRTVRDGRTVEHEMILLEVRDGRFAYEAHPSGQPPAVFLAREATGDRVVFENSGHDFPQRVGYERQGADRLLAWIEGTANGRSRRIEFPYQRTACP